WLFLPLAVPFDAQAKACKIEFEMRYAFANGPLEALINPVFDRIANTFVDAFVRRAEQVYGTR
ncbi:MAG TPA: SRPBCC family protein, partial [Caldimonas sp.]